jgi:hypothetical protein
MDHRRDLVRKDTEGRLLPHWLKNLGSGTGIAKLEWVFWFCLFQLESP